MKQILQNLKTGQTQLEDIPVPQSKNRHLLNRTSASIISAGTERMLIDFGKAGMLGKSRQQPEKVKQMLDKIRTDGLLPTVEASNSNFGNMFKYIVITISCNVLIFLRLI